MDRALIDIKYRYVPFGTTFQEVDELAPQSNSVPTSGQKLYLNEFAVDVGSVCVGFTPGVQRVIDHHFPREEANFPSAAAAILHLGEYVEQWLAQLPAEVNSVCLVTHRSPDFDAVASLTILEALIRKPLGQLDRVRMGLGATGWTTEVFIAPNGEKREAKFNWYGQGGLSWISDAESRYLFWLAIVASLTDQCKPYSVPVEWRLPSLMSAAAVRGRNWEDRELQRSFFTAIKSELDRGANPLYDCLLESDSTFEFERAVLKRAVPAYVRDLAKAKTFPVLVPVDLEFQSHYQGTLVKNALLAADGTCSALHLKGTENSRSLSVESIWIRDPECPIFKDLARRDSQNSSAGRGFAFTAVAYSNRYAGSINRSEYYFSLDPEYPQFGHLYPIWAKLQTREVFERRQLGIALSLPDRKNFEERARGYEGHFQDPWFDGGNFHCSIVVSPGNGCHILPEGQASDLSDDEVARIVSTFFTENPYDMDSTVTEWSESGESQGSEVPISTSLGRGTFRLVEAPLAVNTERITSALAGVVGQDLWRSLHGDAGKALPSDFASRHLWWSESAVAVWSRNGLGIAWLPEGKQFVNEANETLGVVAKVSLAHGKLAKASGPKDAEEMKKLLEEIANVRWTISHSRCRAIARFLEALDFDRQIQALYEVKSLSASNNTLDKIEGLQSHASLIESVVFAVYALEVGHVFASGAHEQLPGWTTIFLVVTLALGGLSFLVPKFGKQTERSHSMVSIWPQVLALLLIVILGWRLSEHAHHLKADKEKAAETRRGLAHEEQVDALKALQRGLQVLKTEVTNLTALGDKRETQAQPARKLDSGKN